MAGENEVVPDATTTDSAAEASALAAFSSGFEESVDTPPSETPKAPEPQADATPPEPAGEKTAPTPPTPAAEPPQAEYVQLTKAEYEEWKSMRANWPKWVSAVQAANGNAGDAKMQVQSLQKALSGDGSEIELDSKDLDEDYPELADRLKKMLKPVLKKRGATFDPDEVRKLANEIVDAREKRALDEHHPGWEETVGTAASDNPFRRWLAQQEPGYRKQVLDSKSSSFLRGVLDSFERSKSETPSQAPPPATPPPAAAAAPEVPKTPVPTPAPAQPARGTIQRQRMRAAVQPNGQPGATVPNVKSPNDHFMDGWNEG